MNAAARAFLLIPLVFSAWMASAGNAPLVTIRFNQPHVYYDGQLRGAVSRALAAKPDVVFEVVSVAPVTGNASLDARWQATAGHNTKAVIEDLQAMGVPPTQIRVKGQTQPDLKFDETQVFVE